MSAEHQALMAEARRVLAPTMGYTLEGLARGYSYEAPQEQPKPPPGRQPLRMPGDGSLSGLFGLGGSRPWRGPLPREAREGSYRAHHKFPAGSMGSDGGAYSFGEPPLSFICPACELEQPPIQGDRDCPYCGLHIHPHGSRLYWWRENVPEVQPWKP